MSLYLQLPNLSAFSVHVTVYIAEKSIDAFYASMKTVLDAVAAEPQLVYFELFQDPVEPGKISWIENWNASTEWLMNVQLTKEYYKPYLETTMPMYVKEREFRILKRMGSNFVIQKAENSQ